MAQTRLQLGLAGEVAAVAVMEEAGDALADAAEVQRALLVADALKQGLKQKKIVTFVKKKKKSRNGLKHCLIKGK